MNSVKSLPLPPFDMDKAQEKVAVLDKKWNNYLPETVCTICAPAVEWQENINHASGIENVHNLVGYSWRNIKAFKSKRTLWGFRVNRMAVRFVFEWQDLSGSWFRDSGNELLEFNDEGKLLKRIAFSCSELITETELSI